MEQDVGENDSPWFECIIKLSWRNQIFFPHHGHQVVWVLRKLSRENWFCFIQILAGKLEYIPERTTQDMAVTVRFWREESLSNFKVKGMGEGWVKTAHVKCKQVRMMTAAPFFLDCLRVYLATKVFLFFFLNPKNTNVAQNPNQISVAAWLHANPQSEQQGEQQPSPVNFQSFCCKCTWKSCSCCTL